MLARNAESLYWIGRYVERADDTARILDVSVHQLLEDATVNPDTESRQLLAVLGITPPDGATLDVWSLTELVAYSAANAGSIVASVTSARENTRGAREVVSTEMWECLNSMWNSVPERQRYARQVGPHAFFSFVEERAAMFAGLADSTMSRDDGWRFVVLGRSLERVDMTARLLAVRVLAAVHAPDWPTLLSASGADEAFMRAHGAASEPAKAAAFLLLDRGFPRSVLHALTAAEECLTELGGRPVSWQAPEPGRMEVGRMRTRLEYLNAAELDQLPVLLGELQLVCGAASKAVAERYFPYDGPVEWSRQSALTDLSPGGLGQRDVARTAMERAAIAQTLIAQSEGA